MTSIFRIIFIPIFFFLSFLISAQEVKRNLTSILEELSESMDIKISYSPNLTKDIYITTPFSTSYSIDDYFNLILPETGFAFRKIDEYNYFIYKKDSPKPKPVIVEKTVPPPVVRPPRDTFIISMPQSSFRLADKTKLSYTSALPYLNLHHKPIPPKELLQIRLKVNGLPLFFTTLDYGIELGLSERLSLDLTSSVSGWPLGETASLNHYGIQPELRVWCKERFKGSFFGANLLTYYYNIGGISFIESLKDYRYQGLLLGTGVSYGYNYSFSDKWAIEATVGVGFAHILYHKSGIDDTSEPLASGHRNYFGLTKLGLSIVYRVN